MKMQQENIRIGQLAKDVGVERFVIRFWEKEFGIESIRSSGGQRFYSHKDIDFFKKIKHLLYDQKYTIEGAKHALKQADGSNYIASCKTSIEPEPATMHALLEQLKNLRDQLAKLRENL